MPNLHKRIQKIVGMMESGLIFSNRKTDLSVELNVCPLMKLSPVGKEGKTKFTSPKCKSCYAVDLLNIYNPLRKKLMSIPKEKKPLLKTFEKDIQLAIALFPVAGLGELKRIRFYGVSDFSSDNIPFILIAAKYLTVDIISKTLAMKHNQDCLEAIINKKNVWISLSFNKTFNNDIPRIEALLKKKRAKNVQLNYCLHTNEEDPNSDYFKKFQVLHFRDKDKDKILKSGVPAEKICGLYDRDGNSLAPKASGSHCKNCSNCHIGYVAATKKA